jgi:hypothetical protein
MSSEGYVRAAQLAALKQPEALVDALGALDAPPAEVAATLRAHHVSGLVRASLEDASNHAADRALIAAIDGARPPRFLSTAEYLDGFVEIRGALEQEAVPVLLLKGVYFAERLYGGSRWRPQYDVDILIRPAHRLRARRVLDRAGFVRAAYDLHAETFTRARLKVDVHGWLRRAPAYHIDDDRLWESSVQITVGGLVANTLSDEFTLVMLVLGTFEDLGQGMSRLKQLLDCYLLLRQMDASTDWEGFFERRAEENIDGVTLAIIELTVALFSAENEVPRLTTAIRRRTRTTTDSARALALALLFAPRKHPANMAWFGRVYPGQLSYYLLWFWLGGFPANVRAPSLAHAAAAARVALGWRIRV